VACAEHTKCAPDRSGRGRGAGWWKTTRCSRAFQSAPGLKHVGNRDFHSRGLESSATPSQERSDVAALSKARRGLKRVGDRDFHARGLESSATGLWERSDVAAPSKAPVAWRQSKRNRTFTRRMAKLQDETRKNKIKSGFTR
jgi:hypothetical protein